MRLDKMLANSGVGSRKDIKNMVKSGIVTVNGQIVKKSDIHINENTDKVCVNGAPVEYCEFVYLMLNKPAGYVSATEDFKYPTVIDLVPEQYRHYDLFPVGRLDIDTEGLLILTNDGAYAHNVLSPKKHVYKTYYAELDVPATEDDVNAFANGITIEGGYTCKEAELTLLDGETPSALVRICEGKFHQVKLMFKAVGKTVTYLKRIKFGEFELPDDLPLGEFTEIYIKRE
ncbi:MAG: rRNA pseudouridine synthase [Clostridia bacterium]|nr:rRNA pseudouridine synthase [Clostridia bacterium]